MEPSSGSVPALRPLGIGMALLFSVAALPVARAQPVDTVPAEPTAGATGEAAPGRWTALSTGTTADLAAVSFSDPSAGHVVGAAGTILATTDGGRTWKAQTACTAGKTCLRSSSDRLTADLTGVAFWDRGHGVAVGAGGTIVSTEDGGRNWAPRLACERPRNCQAGSPDRTTADLTAVSVAAPSHAYAVGKAGTMLASDDYGRTWRRLPGCGLDSEVGRPCGEGPPAKDPPDLFGVTATSARSVHAVGARGAMFKTGDGGRTMYRIGVCVEGCDPPVVPVEEQLKELQQGILAPRFQPPLITTDLAGVALPDPRRSRLYAVGAAGTILTNAFSSRWAPRFACATTEPCVSSSPDRVRSDLRAIAFPNDVAGYAVGAGGTIVSLMRPSAPSRGSGDTATLGALGRWRTDDGATTNDLHAVAFPTPDTGFAVGDAGTVVKRSRQAPGVQIEDIEPARGPTVGRTKVTITGKGFTGATGVYFGPLRSLGHTVDSDKQVTAIAPARAAGVAHVTVSTPAGPSPGVAAARYSYNAPLGGTWERAASCSPACPGPAVVLRDGRVLAAGGPFRRAGSATAGIYDPRTRTWTGGAPLAQARSEHSVTALADGRALVAGGFANLSAPGRVPDLSPRLGAEVYDPRAGTWGPAGDLGEPRFDHSATLLADGRVLVTGGRSGAGQSGAEIWDPRTGAWRPTASMATGRFAHTASRMAGGTVLVAGGCSPTCQAPGDSAEIFEPTSQRWRRVAPMKVARGAHTANVMANGDVMVVGGVTNGEKAVASAERYDAKKGTWTKTAHMHVPRALHSATVLGDGRLLVAGGVTDDPAREGGGDLAGDVVASAEVYDPGTDRWSLVSEMPSPRALDAAVPLRTACGRDCGKTLMAGGTESSEPLVLYQPAEADIEASASGIGGGVVLLSAAGLVAILGAFMLARRARRR